MRRIFTNKNISLRFLFNSSVQLNIIDISVMREGSIAFFHYFYIKVTFVLLFRSFVQLRFIKYIYMVLFNKLVT